MNPKIFNNLLLCLKTLTAEQKQQVVDFITNFLNGIMTEPVHVVEVTADCPHCLSKNTAKNGKRAGRQRYLCKDCGKTFGNSNGTPLYRSRLPLFTVEKLIEQIILGRSIPQIATDCGVNTKTVWLFRQKLMAAIKKRNGSQDFFGSGSIVEADEYFLPLSFKGKRDLGFFLNILRRMPRHHYTRVGRVNYLKKNGFYWLDYVDLIGKARRGGWSNEQVAILTAVDRAGKAFIEPICLAAPAYHHITKSLTGKHTVDIVLVTDGHNAYKSYCKSSGVNLEQVKAKDHARGAFHLAHVNSYHNRLNNFMPPYALCSSKYLDFYTALFRYSDKTRSWKTGDRVAPLMELAMSRDGGYISGGELAVKELPFDDLGLMQRKAKGATLVGRALQSCKKIINVFMGFFM